jgi:hypothetical protein
MKNRIIFFFCALLLSAQAFSAQAPQVIDVQSYEINKKVYWTVAKYIMLARDSSGAPIEFVGTGNYTVSPLMSCDPCSLPNVFSSNGFFTEPYGFSFTAGFDTPVRFIVSEVDTEPIELRPTVLRKRRVIAREGAVRVKGRVEVRAGDTIVAVDNDVYLTGTYAAEFAAQNALDGRKIQFAIISYNLRQTP